MVDKGVSNTLKTIKLVCNTFLLNFSCITCKCNCAKSSWSEGFLPSCYVVCLSLRPEAFLFITHYFTLPLIEMELGCSAVYCDTIGFHDVLGSVW